MTREEAYNRIDAIIAKHEIDDEYVTIISLLDYDALRMARKALEQESCEDAVSREAVLGLFAQNADAVRPYSKTWEEVKALPSVNPQPKWISVREKYEHHIDHTDCIWYGNDSGCPVTCSQYRDGWNDAMDYIFKNGDGYRPYRRDENG